MGDLAQQLEKFKPRFINQRADLIAWDGTILKARNIIGAYKPESKNASCFVRIGTAGRMPTMIPTPRITTRIFSGK